MKFTVTGSLGNISKTLTELLIKAGHEITVISSNAEKKSAIEALGAKAAIGSVSDTDFLTKAFQDADAVYTMVPPNLMQNNYRDYMSNVGRNFAAAIKNSGVKRVVNLSSIGAHLPDGTGPIKGLHDVEHILNALEGVSVKHLRAGFFYYNFFGNIDMIRHAHILGSNYDADAPVNLVHPKDIAEVAAKELQHPFSGKSYRYVISDERKASDVAKVLGTAVGQPDLPWIQFTDEAALEGMTNAGLPQSMAGAYVEMGRSIANRSLWEDRDQEATKTFEPTKLEDFASEFSKVYNG